jgi:hypothetical protein
MKHFTYPLPDLAYREFSHPDNPCFGMKGEDGSDYFGNDFFSLRTETYHNHHSKPATIPAAHLAAHNRARALADDQFTPLDDLRGFICKFPVQIWERTHTAHHLMDWPIMRVHCSYALRGILQLACKLPRAEIYKHGTSTDPILIRFNGGTMVQLHLPWAERAVIERRCKTFAILTPKPHNPLTR